MKSIINQKVISKEKAIDNIKEALKYTAKTALIETSPADKAVAVYCAETLLLRALTSWRIEYDRRNL